MITVINILLVLLAIGFVAVIGTFSAQCLAAMFAGRETPSEDRRKHPRLVVLMPAHNEADVIAVTISSVLTQLAEKDRLLVVADNCEDETAAGEEDSAVAAAGAA